MDSGVFVCWTFLSPGVLFEGVQIGLSSTLEQARYLLENEEEFMVVGGDEVEVAETEEEVNG